MEFGVAAFPDYHLQIFHSALFRDHTAEFWNDLVVRVHVYYRISGRGFGFSLTFPRGSTWPLPGRFRILSRCSQEFIDRGITRYRVLHIQFMSSCGVRPRRLAPAPFKGFDRQVHPHREPPHPPLSTPPSHFLAPYPAPSFPIADSSYLGFVVGSLSQWFFLPREKLLMSMLFLP